MKNNKFKILILLLLIFLINNCLYYNYAVNNKKVKGILKFYLVETEPEFKLYASPINYDPREPFFSISYPKSYSRELAEKIGLYHTQGMPIDTWAVNENRLSEPQLVEMLNEVLTEKTAMLDFESRII